MQTTNSTARKIREHLSQMPMGKPFTPTHFLEYGTRAAVDQTLHRLAKSGEIFRVARGLFVRPQVSRYVGQVMPEPMQLAEAIAEATESVVRVNGAEAARRFELTTQMPTQVVFCTSGPSKRLHMGKLEFRLQHVCPRKMVMAKRPAGLALAALWYLGKTEVTPAHIEKIRSKLSQSEFSAFKSAASSMPAWMSNAIHAHERSSAHG